MNQELALCGAVNSLIEVKINACLLFIHVNHIISLLTSI
ncbi:MAG: hypothetical protein OFPII_31170 [Osedax symbiont Rs1]|nr:MAG: hypothetical protein OFPII_31170 [Osedax symbiont Rs1]